MAGAFKLDITGARPLMRVEQQGKTAAELDRLWDPGFWTETFEKVHEYDRQIDAFNKLAAG